MFDDEDLFSMEIPQSKSTNLSFNKTNGGTVVAIAGEDFAIIAGDTRLSDESGILSRTQSKLRELSPKTVLGYSGHWGDAITLADLVETKLLEFELQHYQTMQTKSVANMLSIMMYDRRYSPYKVSNVIAGLDKKGSGVVYSYDLIGYRQLCPYWVAGTANLLLHPVLDNQIGHMGKDDKSKPKLKMQEALEVIKVAFKSAAERDIYTGDSAIIKIITKDGIETEHMELRKD